MVGKVQTSGSDEAVSRGSSSAVPGGPLPGSQPQFIQQKEMINTNSKELL